LDKNKKLKKCSISKNVQILKKKFLKSFFLEKSDFFKKIKKTFGFKTFELLTNENRKIKKQNKNKNLHDGPWSCSRRIRVVRHRVRTDQIVV
jgi:hypothetical protein